ncbi:hypothetical protein J2Y63_005400 [Shinella sp. BE166]|uniref:hypothetical protein n=1 Tax=Shinella sp. BE166 TaxID=3373918 RepID=UPI003EBC8795
MKKEGSHDGEAVMGEKALLPISFLPHRDRVTFSDARSAHPPEFQRFPIWIVA